MVLGGFWISKSSSLASAPVKEVNESQSYDEEELELDEQEEECFLFFLLFLCLDLLALAFLQALMYSCSSETSDTLVFNLVCEHLTAL